MLRLLVLSVILVVFAVMAVACAGDDTTSVSNTTAAAVPPAESPEPAVPVAAASDQAAYRQSIIGKGIVQETCAYDADVGIADCETRGRYALNPVPSSVEGSCIVGLLKEAPQYVLCSFGGESKFYPIQP